MKTRRRLARLAAVLGLWSTGPAIQAQTASGESTFPFDPWHARAVALGDAGVAMVGQEFATLNPAATIGGRGAELSHRASPIGVRDYELSVGHGSRWATVRATIRRRDWGDLAQDLGVEGLTAGEQSLAVTVADRAGLGPWAWGLSVARLEADYLGTRTGTWATDLGVQLTVNRGLTLGAALLHAGRGFPSGMGVTPLPTRFLSGAAWERSIGRLDVVAAGDVAVPIRARAPPDLHAGAEIRHTTGAVTVGMRAGYRSLANRDGSGSSERMWTVGGGLRVRPIQMDVAYSLNRLFGSERLLSLSIAW